MSKRRVHILTAVNASAVSKTGGKYTIKGVCGAVNDIVMNGMLYPADQLAKGVATLNGKPAPAGHPKNDAGQYISALNGEALLNAYIGSVCTNARHEGGKTLVDVVVNEAQAKAHPDGAKLVERLDAAIAGNNADPIHVSTGLFVEAISANGESLGKKYDRIATNLQYDHLAILLNQTGAGTPEQGVGMFLNSEGVEERVDCAVLSTNEAGTAKAEKSLKDAIALHEKHMNGTAPTTGADGEKSQMKMMRMMKAALDYLTGKEEDAEQSDGNSKNKPKGKGMGGMKMNADNQPADRRNDGLTGWLRKLLGNGSVELSFDQISSGLYALMPDGAWLRDVYDRHVIWTDSDGGHFRQDYAVGSDGSLSFTSDPQAVKREVSYVPITNRQEVDQVKETIIAALNAAGISGVAAMTDAQLLTAYNALQAKPHLDALNAEQTAHGATKGKLAEFEVAANAARDAELNTLAAELATNSSLTADDFKAMGLPRLKELKAKAAPVVVGNSGIKPGDEFAGYSLNAFIEEKK